MWSKEERIIKKYFKAFTIDDEMKVGASINIEIDNSICKIYERVDLDQTYTTSYDEMELLLLDSLVHLENKLIKLLNEIQLEKERLSNESH